MTVYISLSVADLGPKLGATSLLFPPIPSLLPSSIILFPHPGRPLLYTSLPFSHLLYYLPFPPLLFPSLFPLFPFLPSPLSPARGSGEYCQLPSRVQSRASAASALLTILTRDNTSGDDRFSSFYVAGADDLFSQSTQAQKKYILACFLCTINCPVSTDACWILYWLEESPIDTLDGSQVQISPLNPPLQPVWTFFILILLRCLILFCVHCWRILIVSMCICQKLWQPQLILDISCHAWNGELLVQTG